MRDNNVKKKIFLTNRIYNVYSVYLKVFEFAVFPRSRKTLKRDLCSIDLVPQNYYETFFLNLVLNYNQYKYVV